jgi:flagellar protein FlaG
VGSDSASLFDADALEADGRGVVDAVTYRREDVQRAVDEANLLAETFPEQRISFALDEDSDRLVVRVIDNQTNEVVRQVPPQEFLELIAKVQQMVGLFFDEVA